MGTNQLGNKKMSLKEARKREGLPEFTAQHPSVADRKKFEQLLDAVCRSEKPEEEDQT